MASFNQTPSGQTSLALQAASLTLTYPYLSGDPNFSSVSLLLHMDGSNGSTTFTDNSSNTLTVTPTDNAQISTAQSKFGGASGLFDGTGDWLTASLPSAIGTGDFTVEAWIYINSLASLAPLCCLGDNLQASGLLLFITTGGRISAFGNNASIATGSTQTVSTSVWTHIAISRSGSSLKLFVNGINDGTATNSANLSVASTQIGRELYNAATGAQLNGYIDDLRITKGVARYTANFTPPTAAFPDGTFVNPYLDTLSTQTNFTKFITDSSTGGETVSFVFASPVVPSRRRSIKNVRAV